MLNILKGVKLAQDDSTGDLYAVDCVDGPKKLTGGSSSSCGFDFIITMDATDGSFSLASGSYSDIKEKLLASQPVLGVSHKVVPGEAAQTRIMSGVYYVYADEHIECEEAAVGGSTYKIHPDNTVENV